MPRSLDRAQRRDVALLGVPTFGLALAVTTVTTYLPVVAKPIVGSLVVIGLIVGIEGLIALWLPLVAGTWSDRLRTRIGGRLPFLAVAAPVVVAGLLAMALVGSLAGFVIASLVFFLGYFTAYEPYRALYPDLLDDDVAGRAQGIQALWRGLGTGVALISGGLLLGLGRGAPFVAGAGLFVLAVGAFAWALARRGVSSGGGGADTTVGREARRVWELLRDDRTLQAFLVANGLWELSLAALKTFVVLYVTRGMGYSRTTASLVIGGVAVFVLAAAFASGKLADRVGHVRVLKVALPLYGGALLIPFVFSSPLVVAISAPFVAAGGGAIMALPYALLMQLMPEGEHGALTGYYSVSRGLGAWLGPLLGGIAVTGLAGLFSATKGFQAVWGVCALAILASLVPLRRVRGGQ